MPRRSASVTEAGRLRQHGRMPARPGTAESSMRQALLGAPRTPGRYCASAVRAGGARSQLLVVACPARAGTASVPAAAATSARQRHHCSTVVLAGARIMMGADRRLLPSASAPVMQADRRTGQAPGPVPRGAEARQRGGDDAGCTVADTGASRRAVATRSVVAALLPFRSLLTAAAPQARRWSITAPGGGGIHVAPARTPSACCAASVVAVVSSRRSRRRARLPCIVDPADVRAPVDTGAMKILTDHATRSRPQKVLAVPAACRTSLWNALRRLARPKSQHSIPTQATRSLPRRARARRRDGAGGGGGDDEADHAPAPAPKRLPPGRGSM